MAATVYCDLCARAVFWNPMIPLSHFAAGFGSIFLGLVKKIALFWALAPRSGETQVVRVCAGGAVFLAIARRSCCVFHVLVLLCFGIACVSHFHVFSIFRQSHMVR